MFIRKSTFFTEMEKEKTKRKPKRHLTFSTTGLCKYMFDNNIWPICRFQEAKVCSCESFTKFSSTIVYLYNSILITFGLELTPAMMFTYSNLCYISTKDFKAITCL